MDFMKCIWDSDQVAYVTLVVRDYPAEGVTLDAIKPMIQEIREKSSGMIIKADLTGVPFVSIDRLRLVVKMVKEVVEYTREDKLLRQIQFINTGFIFRTLYGPVSLTIPKCFRDIVVFL